MSVISDMSDVGIVAQFGDIVHELPELYEALRHFELQSRPVESSFKMRGRGISVQRCGGMLRLQVGHPGCVK